MHSNFTVIFDACVLYPFFLRDMLMRLALTNLFRAKWTDQIHEEWIRNLLKDRPEIPKERLIKTRQKMDTHVLDALVENYEVLIDSLQLPDPDDRHVLAAAIKSNADLIVTCNLKDFPPEFLKPYEIEALHPDEFISDLFDLDSFACTQAIKAQLAAYKNPKLGIDEYLVHCRKQGLAKTANRLESIKVLFG